MSNPNVQPLAQDFVVAAQVPEHDRYFFHDPNMTRLDDGGLLIAAPQWGPSRYGTGPRKDRAHAMELRIIRSDDGGQTWEDLPSLDTWGRHAVCRGRPTLDVRPGEAIRELPNRVQ